MGAGRCGTEKDFHIEGLDTDFSVLHVILVVRVIKYSIDLNGNWTIPVTIAVFYDHMLLESVYVSVFV